MKPRDYYDSLIDNMPAGAERAVMRVLSYHVGLDNAISKDPEPDPQKSTRKNLMDECARLGVHLKDERQVRKVIVDLRKRGVPVCSSSGDSGYFLAANLAEYQEFRGREYVKKIVDMRETVTKMDSCIKQMFQDQYTAYKRAQAESAGQPSLLET